MDRYVRVEKPKDEAAPIAPNEARGRGGGEAGGDGRGIVDLLSPNLEAPPQTRQVRITTQGKARSYVTYALSLLQVRADFLYFLVGGQQVLGCAAARQRSSPLLL